jgi:hypothetical protein
MTNLGTHLVPPCIVLDVKIYISHQQQASASLTSWIPHLTNLRCRKSALKHAHTDVTFAEIGDDTISLAAILKTSLKSLYRQKS